MCPGRLRTIAPHRKNKLAGRKNKRTRTNPRLRPRIVSVTETRFGGASCIVSTSTIAFTLSLNKKNREREKKQTQTKKTTKQQHSKTIETQVFFFFLLSWYAVAIFISDVTQKLEKGLLSNICSPLTPMFFIATTAPFLYLFFISRYSPLQPFIIGEGTPV